MGTGRRSFDHLGNGWLNMGELEKWRCGRRYGLNQMLRYAERGKKRADIAEGQSHGNEGFVELERKGTDFVFF